MHQFRKYSEGKRKKAIATFGGGCFWCVEALFQQVKGVEKVISGYSGGRLKNPTYKEVCSGLTGHVEVVRAVFNPDIISYRELLSIFFEIHVPLSIETGKGRYSQYKSVIFYHNNEQKNIAESFFEAQKTVGKEILTELIPFFAFYEAEPYHQDYYLKDPEKVYCKNVIEPKLKKLRASQRTDLLKEE